MSQLDLTNRVAERVSFAVPPLALPPEGWTFAALAQELCAASALAIDHFHRVTKPAAVYPQVRLHLGYFPRALALLFVVTDHHVIARHQTFQAPVCTDSCVEAFISPQRNDSYFNFEFNCIGTMLAYYCTRPRTKEDDHKFSAEEGALVQVQTSLKGPILTEIPGPLDWTLAAVIPVSLLERHIGPLGPLAGQRWNANFYKCADHSSHPHWASWSPIGKNLDFHVPRHFGEIRFLPA
ncbi:MAG: carbohydrate-binding family 9-like protein [Phycisphaerae bacterium]